MQRNKSFYRESDINNYCNSLANKNLILVTIFAAIINQEIENDEELGILGSFLITLGEELALASETRIACKAKFEENKDLGDDFLEVEVEDTFDRSCLSSNEDKKVIKVKKKYIKKNKK